MFVSAIPCDLTRRDPEPPPVGASRRLRRWALAACVAPLAACSSGGTETTSTPSEIEGTCEIGEAGASPNYLVRLGCRKDFDALASDPMDDTIPGARSSKVVVDTYASNALYFQNSKKYPIHYEFVSANLSTTGASLVGTKEEFDSTQYTTPDRRFVLGSITYYDQPRVWALELAPYDTASAEMIATLFRAVKANSYFGSVLVFHPTSEAVATVAKTLPQDIPLKTTDELYAAIDYQPLNLGETVGHVRILSAAALTTTYVGYRDIVVLDEVPNDISVVAGLITEQFQTPLSHVNVLAQNRHTPNMGLRQGTTNAKLIALDTERSGQSGLWAKLTVGALGWDVAGVSDADQAAWWALNKPAAVSLPAPDLTVKDLRDIASVTVHTDSAPYVARADIETAIRAFGAKAANYAAFSTDPQVPCKKAFAIPVFYYDQFMRENGFYDFVVQARQDSSFVNDPKVRDAKLATLRAAIKDAPVNAEFQELLRAKLAADFPGHSMRFRSSTNAEDLDGFPCAGCYDSHTGDPADFDGDQLAAALAAIRKTWATAWKFRTYEEREYHGIDHTKVAMALLAHTNFPNEEANGVAVTANPFDPTGNSPGFYINVQTGGDYEVVAPPPGITSDSFIYEYDFPGTPTIYLTHSNVVATPGAHVLTDAQIQQLGTALKAIHTRFAKAYQSGDSSSWYAMDVEFKFDDEATPGAPALFIKQARPYPGRGQ